MNILALEPYYGGSHKAFIDNLSLHSKHQWTLLTLPAYKWKWRMRHSAVFFAEQVDKLTRQGRNWDLIFCCDMLNLAEFKGLVTQQVAQLPTVVYFHENQLTYPVQAEDQRDYQFAMTNITTALSASQIWFNSRYHRDCFLTAVEKFLKKMPDYQPNDIVNTIRQKSIIKYPGIDQPSQYDKEKSDKIRILYCARWEHDKNPDDFFKAIKIIKSRGIDFELNVIGQHFRQIPEAFIWAEDFFKDNIKRWGYQQSRREYQTVLAQSDIAVSTANHEFFGIGIIEAIAAGAYPLLPKRLSYPEILNLENDTSANQFFYDGSVEALADKITELSKLQKANRLWQENLTCAKTRIAGFFWQNLISDYDKTLQKHQK